MRHLKFILGVVFLNGWLWSASIFAQTNVVFTTLVQFNGTNGAIPLGGLIQGCDGNFYGTTFAGGKYGWGTVFKMTPSGVLTTLASFDATNYGCRPAATLMQDTGGILYGTTTAGGTNGMYGTIFSITTNGGLVCLVAFGGTNGNSCQSGLVKGDDGQLYGTTSGGGIRPVYPNGVSPNGTVFKSTTNGVLTSLFSFGNGLFYDHGITNTGIYPPAGLVRGNDGYLYGTTELIRGVEDPGTVFRIDTSGDLETLFLFGGTNGANPTAPLIMGRDGCFYGMTREGGTANWGTVFRMTTAGSLTTLVSFDGTNGEIGYGDPYTGMASWPLVQGSDGNLYGETVRGGSDATSGGGSGTLFQITTNGVLTTLYSFGGSASSISSGPVGGLVQATDGNFYGVTYNSENENGTIFRLTVPLQPVFQSITPTNGTLLLTWNAVAGETYQLQSAADLTTTNWVNLGASILATNGVVSESDSFVGNSQRFYRVVLSQ